MTETKKTSMFGAFMDATRQPFGAVWALGGLLATCLSLMGVASLSAGDHLSAVACFAGIFFALDLSRSVARDVRHVRKQERGEA